MFPLRIIMKKKRKIFFKRPICLPQNNAKNLCLLLFIESKKNLFEN
jgi:hypothetical protein